MIEAFRFLVICVVLCEVHSKGGSCLPCTCCHDDTYGGIKVECSGLNLTHVPRDLPSNTTTLDLHSNAITNIKTGEMKKLTKLRELVLSNNNLSVIYNDSFTGLSKLEILRLDGNDLKSLDNLNYSVFNRLGHLRVLYINETQISKPGRQLSVLVTLHELYIDCWYCDFTDDFSKLTNLSSLTTSYDTCRIPSLRKSTFVNIPNLTSLSLQHCRINHIEQETFESLPHLQILDLSYNWHLGFGEVSSWGLNKTDIQILKMNSVTSFTSKIESLQKNVFRYLKTSKLREIYFDGNVVSYISRDAWDTIPDEFRVLSARYSLFGDFSRANLSGSLKLKNHNVIDITGMMEWDPQGNYRHFLDPSAYHTIVLPSNLQTIKFSNRYVQLDLLEVNVFPPNLVTALYADENFVSSLIGPTRGLQSLKILDVSKNILHEIAPQFFQNNNSLQFLNISNNNLGDCFENDRSGSIFAKCYLIENLDISNNKITTLPTLIFQGLRSVRYLNISKNEMFIFNVAIGHMKDLQHLDLSNNKLQTLPVGVQKDLYLLKQAVVNLQDNPLVCSCQSLQFLQWIRSMQDRIQGLRYIKCLLPNGTRAIFKDVESAVSELNHQCSFSVLLIVIASCIVCVVLGAIGIAGYRCRWKLRYLYHVGRRGYNRVQNEERGENYHYDAFVSYADEDRGFVINKMIPELEEKSGLTLCIHHRDFLPGAVITENIVVSIQNSKKTLIVLSPSFLKSDWCTYEFNMARVDGLSRKQNTIVMVLYENVPLKDTPKDLAVMLSYNSYLEYNVDLYGEIIFWQNLVEAIKTPQQLH